MACDVTRKDDTNERLVIFPYHGRAGGRHFEPCTNKWEVLVVLDSSVVRMTFCISGVGSNARLLLHYPVNKDTSNSRQDAWDGLACFVVTSMICINKHASTIGDDMVNKLSRCVLKANGLCHSQLETWIEDGSMKVRCKKLSNVFESLEGCNVWCTIEMS